MPNGQQRELCSLGCGQQYGAPPQSLDGAGRLGFFPPLLYTFVIQMETDKLTAVSHQVLAPRPEDILRTWCFQWKWRPGCPVLHDRSYDYLLFYPTGYHHLVLPCSVVGYPHRKWFFMLCTIPPGPNLTCFVYHRLPCSRRNLSQPRKLSEKCPGWLLSWSLRTLCAGDLTPSLPVLLRLTLDMPSIPWLLPCLLTLPRAPPSTTQSSMSSWTDRFVQHSDQFYELNNSYLSFKRHFRCFLFISSVHASCSSLANK